MCAGLYWWDAVAGYSALAGVLSGLVPNWMSAAKVFGARARKRMDDEASRGGGSAAVEFGSLCRAEVTKLVAMAALLVVVFGVVEPLNAGALMGGFLIAHLSFVIAMMCSDLGSDDLRIVRDGVDKVEPERN